MAYPLSVQWKKGQSGNPTGRPKKEFSITSILREKLEEKLPDGRTKAQALVDRFIEIGLGTEDNHALVAIKHIVDRLEGTPMQSITADINEKRPIMISAVANIIDDETDSTNS